MEEKSLVLILFLFLGLASLLPLNALISTTEYYDFRLKGSPFEKSYESIFLIANNGTNLFLNLFFVVFPQILTDTTLVLAGYILDIFAFVFIIALTLIPSLDPTFFIYVTSFLMFAHSVFSGFMLVGQSRLMTKHVMSATAISALNLGQALSGIIITLLNYLIIHLIPWKVGFIEFTLSIVVLINSLCLFWVFKKDIVNLKMNQVTDEPNVDDMEKPLLEGEEEESAIEAPELSRGQVIYAAKKLLISLLINYIVTLSCFPALSNRLPSDITAASFFFFNLSDFLGRVITFNCHIKSENVILGICVVRIYLVKLFIDMIYTYNLSYTALYILACFLHFVLGLSNGFLASNSFIVIATKFAREIEINVAATSATLCIGLGLTIGSFASMSLIK